MTKTCTRCGNTALPDRQPLGNGVSSRPCPICGEQNYCFPRYMRKTDGGARTCEYEGCDNAVDTTNGQYCSSCRRQMRKFAALGAWGVRI